MGYAGGGICKHVSFLFALSFNNFEEYILICNKRYKYNKFYNQNQHHHSNKN